MRKELEKIKNEKIKEAELLFETIGIIKKNEKEEYFSEIPLYSKNSNPKENEEIKFHWTRLSINSNSSSIIE